MHEQTTGLYSFRYNSGLDGNVQIRRSGEEQSEVFEVSGVELLRFVAEWIRKKKISELEDASAAKIFGVKETGFAMLDGQVD